METTLIAVTLSSLLVAGLMGIVLLRMLREERQRSDARVALLQDFVSERSREPHGDGAEPHAALRLHISDATTAAPSSPLILDAFETEDLDLRPHGTPSGLVGGAQSLFESQPAESPWRRRLAVAAALAVLAAGVAGAWRWGKSDVAPQPTAAAARAAQRPLELLTMSHAYENDVLTISGVVLNPPGSAGVTNLEVAGVVFDPSGVQAASGRAPLDFRILSPGTESPFVLRIPVTGHVARYRVGFRTSDDQIVAHVDRRDRASLARKQAP